MTDRPDHANQDTPDEQYLQFYNLESYLFDTVRQRFAIEGHLNGFDFFCIVIWKANRAKSKIAKKLLKAFKGMTLDDAVLELTKGIATQETPAEKLRFMLSGKTPFALPMATAILSVLYPEEFTIYDRRVCEVLGKFEKLKNITKFAKLWDGYVEFKRAVESRAPKGLSLRDKDRYLWGMSFANQLRSDVANGFSKSSDDDNEDFTTDQSPA